MNIPRRWRNKGASCLGALSFLWSTTAIAQTPTQIKDGTILNTIQKTGLFTIAIREDAVPFGFRDGPANQWTGICVDLAEVLRQRISAELGGQPLMVKVYQSTLFNRFTLVDEGVVMVECGPNTIRENLPYAITFSRPFLTTGTQLLIRSEELRAFERDPDLAGKRIGALRRSSNQEFISKTYPQATVVEFQGTTGRKRGVRALVQQKIDAFASDGILLFGEALLLNLAFGRDYVLYPNAPLDCSQYGLILPTGDRQWETLVNEVLISPTAKGIYRKWVGEIFPAIERIYHHCSPKDTPASETPP